MTAVYNLTCNVDTRNSQFQSIGGDQINNYGDFLLKLKPADMDASKRMRCLDGTRTQVLQSIKDWVTDSSVDQRIFWLHGPVGSGKSTISTTIASSFADMGCLGAFLFFNRDEEERSHPSRVIRTIAYNLGSCDEPQIGAAIAGATNNTDITLMPLDRQFAKLVVGPISGFTAITRPIVIVLDALDECGRVKDRKELLEVLADETIKIPSALRIILTSRKEADITKAFMDKRHVHVRELELTTNDNMEDIVIFIRHRMCDIREKNSDLPLGPDWPGEHIIKALASRAAGLFVWASIACLFIEAHAPQERLDMLLQGDVDASAQSALDGLYATALKSLDIVDDPHLASDFLSIMGTIIVARNPLSDKAMDSILCLKRPSRHTIYKLGCVLMTDNNLIRIIHPSFADYLSTRNRCQSDALYIDRQLHNRLIAIHSLNLLNGFLRRNICNLTLSMERVIATLPESICYASMSWIAHVVDMIFIPESFADILEQFLSDHLLHWMEAMSILNKSKEVITSLSSLLLWVEKYLNGRSKLRDLIYDGHRFADLFTPVIEQHPLLIYESALPFTPTDTALYAKFHHISGIPRIAGRVERLWSPRIKVLKHEQSVLSVAMTANGTHIISGLDDGTICIWDAASGVETSPRLKGHSKSVFSVSCSPDGARIASGSDDSTIRIWDIKSSAEFAVLSGHESRVTSVCFSPNYSSCVMSLISGSWDHTIRVWSVLSSSGDVSPVVLYVVGQCTSSINAVAFAPDGRRFVAGAANGTVRVRDTDSGCNVLLLSGTQTAIQSIAFSPNGQWVVSGSNDGAIRIWDAELGTQPFQPLKSHEYSQPIRSLAFFPDGNRIASGAENGTIRVWDLKRGKEDCPPLKEHPRSVEGLVISSDGRRIISGSKDHSIGIWDTGYLAQVQTENSHVNAITALALSHDGMCFAVGLKDRSINLLDTYKGAARLCHPLVGHKDDILSLAFSPIGGRMASGADKKDGSVRIWDTVTGKQLLFLRGGNMGSTLSVTFSNDGHRIASGSTDGVIRIWDLSSSAQTPTLSLQGHRAEVRCIAFSPNGTQIVSGSKDSAVRVWDAESGEQISLFLDDRDSFIHSVAFSPDALQIFYISNSHKVIYSWSSTDACGQLLSKTKTNNHRRSHVLDPFVLTSDGWIVNISSDKPVSKLPPNISILAVTASAASKTSLVIVTDRGAVIIMHYQAVEADTH